MAKKPKLVQDFHREAEARLDEQERNASVPAPGVGQDDYYNGPVCPKCQQAFVCEHCGELFSAAAAQPATGAKCLNEYCFYFNSYHEGKCTLVAAHEREPVVADGGLINQLFAAVKNEECVGKTERGEAYNEAIEDALVAMRRVLATARQAPTEDAVGNRRCWASTTNEKCIDTVACDDRGCQLYAEG